MLLAVVGVFYVCRTPYIILNMIVLLGTKTLLRGNIPGWFRMLLEASKILPVVNASLNPLIYAWKIREFRNDFWGSEGLSVRPLALAKNRQHKKETFVICDDKIDGPGSVNSIAKSDRDVQSEPMNLHEIPTEVKIHGIKSILKSASISSFPSAKIMI
ncbi:hypothetical protein CAPTEDRAFT_212117 [Capitella teleta]|uniref:G-protein coupled receptors family 1 profile domain-containing protein n=1 Tax=Capitella teleta TaxID=283909 RepID=R7TP73_CAPTE|nr:hypothetical protein CAPTEDRAFT_212117 [Capitella teleta]|eukprot:ELT92835.1 hypothetical protein CAPTEDRAFT_212117 [Capitella teleta]